MAKFGNKGVEDVEPKSVRKSYASQLDELTAPDGGWGWVILLGSFLSAVIVDGVCFSFGIFYLEFLSYFHENKGKTAWIGSVLNGTYMIMGPIAGALARRYGCRAVAIAGSLWSAIAFFLSTFSPDVNTLIFTYGVLGGIGFGLIYLPAIVIVGFYFDKKRAFATGIATCGSGIGTIIFSPLSRLLIDTYAWKGAMWIVSAIVLNGMVLGCLYRPLTFRELERFRKKYIRRREKRRLKALAKEVKDFETAKVDLEEIAEEDEDVAVEEEINTHQIVENNNVTKDLGEVKILSNNFAKAASYPKLTNGALLSEDTYTKNGACSQSRMDILRLKAIERGQTLRKRTTSNSSHRSLDERRAMPGIGDSWHSLSGYASSMDNMAAVRDDSDSSSISSDVNADQKTGGCISLLEDIKQAFRETMDFSMLCNPVFSIYGLSCILSMAGFFVPFTYLPDHCIGLGYGMAKGAFLLSTLGMANTFGRVAAGWVSDRPWADCLLVNNISLIVGGIATILAPFITSFEMLVIYALVFGVCIAAFVALRSIILADLIGLEKLTSAFGIIVLCQGISSFVGSPLAGSLYDLTGTYNASFYVAGTTITLAGIINLPLRRIARWQAEKEEILRRRKADLDNAGETRDDVKLTSM